jgi:hypothetical protein
MRIKTLCSIRSSSNPSGEMVAEAAPILDPCTMWVRSTMTEAKIQALVEVRATTIEGGGGVEGGSWGGVPN